MGKETERKEKGRKEELVRFWGRLMLLPGAERGRTTLSMMECS